MAIRVIVWDLETCLPLDVVETEEGLLTLGGDLKAFYRHLLKRHHEDIMNHRAAVSMAPAEMSHCPVVKRLF